MKKSYILVGLLIVSIFIMPTFVNAQEAPLKDTDLDGISDTAETTIYKTDPTKPDTDGDGVLDYQEIIDKTNPLDKNSSKLLNAKQAQDAPIISLNSPYMWFIGRISGIASFIMFTVVICFGLLMTSKILLKYRAMMPSDALDTHMFTATFVAFSLLIIHIISFIFDDYIKLKIPEIFIPFLLKRELMSSLNFNLSLPVALGVISFYLAIVLLVTSHLRNKIVSNAVWRKIHYSSFLFYILFVIHGITAGTDTKEPWMLLIYSTSVILVVGLILLKIFGKKHFMPKPKIPAKPLQE